MGWNMDSSASKKRRLDGMNSKQIVVSMGMLPPTPNPTQAVITKKAV